MKNTEKGITLIALIITIIVMLILVAVTINVALNGGLFGKAEEAKTLTNLAKEKEILQTTALGYLDNDGYVDLAEFVSKESPLEGYTLTNNTTYVTASNGTNTFYITKQGGITEEEPQAGTTNILVGKTFYMVDYSSENGIETIEMCTITDEEPMTLGLELDGETEVIQYKFQYQESQSNSVPGILNFTTPVLGMFDYAEVYISNNDVLLRLCKQDNDDYMLLISEINSSMTPIVGTYQYTNSETNVVHTVVFDVVDGYGVYSYTSTSDHDSEEFKPSESIYYLLDSYNKLFNGRGSEMEYIKELNEQTGEYEYTTIEENFELQQ